MKSAGTEHSKNKYTLKKTVNTFNQFVRSIFSILYRLFNCIFNCNTKYYIKLLLFS